MTTPVQFPYEQSPWFPGDPEKARRWYEVLERTGPENVRARLAQTGAGSAGRAISIGTEILTIGFAQEWLARHDRQKAEREAEFRRYWTRWAALAAFAAAVAWGLSAWRNW